MKLWKKITLASQHYSYKKTLFLSAQSAVFISEKHLDVTQMQILNLPLMLKLTLLQKFMKKIYESEFFKGLSTEFQKNFDLIKQIEEIVEAIGLKIANYLTVSFWRRIFMDITRHTSLVQICYIVWRQCNTLLVNCYLKSENWNQFYNQTLFKTMTLDFFSS